MARWTKSLPKKEGWYLLYQVEHSANDPWGGYKIQHLHPATTKQGYQSDRHNYTLEPGALCWGLGETEDSFPHDFFQGWHLYKVLEQPHA